MIVNDEQRPTGSIKGFGYTGQVAQMRRYQSGQGLTEYAIIIALVALVAIVALGLISLAARRGLGIVGGALGANHEERGSTYIWFESNQPPQCGYLPSQDATGLYVQFYTNIN